MIATHTSKSMLAKARGDAHTTNVSRQEKTRARHKPRARAMARELYGGELYEYYPLGKYIVAAPDVCRGRPTFKYTRVEIVPIPEGIAGGWSVQDVVTFYQRPEISPAAVREAIRLAASTWVNTFVERW